MKRIAIILAAGVGNRFGSEKPKQFTLLHKKLVLEYSLEAFQSHPDIDEILLVCGKDYLLAMEELKNEKKLAKWLYCIEGGKERYHSSWNALQFLTQKYGENIQLLFHDAARPFLTQDCIDRCIEGFSRYKAFSTGVKTVDTISIVRDGILQEVCDRQYQWNVQTPQGFEGGVLKAAYEKAFLDKDFSPTDDCSVVLKYMPQVAVGMIQGDVRNIKLTHQEDKILLETYLKS